MLNPDNSQFSFPLHPQPSLRLIQDCRRIAATVDRSILSIAAKDESASDLYDGHRGDVFLRTHTTGNDHEIIVAKLAYDPKLPPTKENPTRGVNKMDSGDSWESYHFERVGSQENYQMRYNGFVTTEFCRDTKTGAVTILAARTQ